MGMYGSRIETIAPPWAVFSVDPGGGGSLFTVKGSVFIVHVCLCVYTRMWEPSRQVINGLMCVSF